MKRAPDLKQQKGRSRRPALAVIGVIACAVIALIVTLTAREDPPPHSRAPAHAAQSDELRRPAAESGEADVVENFESRSEKIEMDEDQAHEEDRTGDISSRRRVRIRGLVLENAAPAPDVEVRARNDEHDRFATARSGKDGRFSIEIETRSYVHLDAVKGQLRGSAGVLLAGDPPEDVRIVLKPAGAVIVTVISRRDGGRAVAGARVAGGNSSDLGEEGFGDLSNVIAERRFGPVETDAEGKATVMILRSGKYVVEAEHDELGVIVEEHELELRDQPQQLTLELRGGSSIFGRVVDDAGAAIRDLYVWLEAKDTRFEYGRRRAKTDAEGHFRIGGVGAGRYTLQAQTTKYVQEPLAIDKKDDTNDLQVELVLGRGLTIEGRVLDEHDAPLAGWKVLAWPPAQRFSTSKRALSRADGSFVLEGLNNAMYALDVVQPGEHLPQSWDEPGVPPVRARGGDRDVILRGHEGATLAGEVSFEAEAAPARFTIFVDGKKHEQATSSLSFVIRGLPSGKATISGSAEGFSLEVTHVELESGRASNVTLVFRPERRIAGRVVDAVSEAPIAGAAIDAMLDDSPVPGRQAVHSAIDGSFVIAGLPPSEASRLVVRAKGYSVAVVSSAAEPIVVRLARGVRVEGRVRYGTERPKSWSGWLRPEDDKAPWFLGREVVTSADGTFVVDGVKPGKCALEFAASFGTSKTVRTKEMPLDVPPAGLSGVDIDFALSGAQLIVSAPSGTEESYHLVLFAGHVDRTTQGQKPLQSQSLDASGGESVFEGLAPGEYTLMAVADRDVWPLDETSFQFIPVKIVAGDQVKRVTLPPF